MDSIKDIERKGNISPFFHNKSVRTNPFGNNLSGYKLYLRAEKIVEAICLVTRHVLASEPSRIYIRQVAISLIPSILALRDEMKVSESNAIVQVSMRIRELISLVRILSISAHISTSNAEILIDALDEIGVLLASSKKSQFSESVLLTRNDLTVKDVGSWRGREQYPAKGQRRISVKDIHKNENSLSDTLTKGHRTENILGALQASKEKLGIKDIVSRFPEYSEKMVQRELKNLIAGGSVKKIGSKRWSMYTLV